MRRFTVPFDLNIEDKIIGGYLSLRQFFWLAIPGTDLITSFTVFKGYLKNENGIIRVSCFGVTFRILLFLFLLAISFIMAFVKIHEIQADKYFFKSIKFKFRKKSFKFNE